MKKIIFITKKTFSGYYFSVLSWSLLGLLTPTLVRAQSSGGVQSGLDKIKDPFGASANFFGSTGGVLGLIARIINIMLTLAGAVAVLFVIIGGFQYITSAGNAEQAEKGRATLVNAIIGIVIIILSYVIINVIVNTVSCTTTGLFGGCY